MSKALLLLLAYWLFEITIHQVSYIYTHSILGEIILLDEGALSVSALRALLWHRGIAHTDIYEKQELIRLTTQSGRVTKGDLQLAISDYQAQSIKTDIDVLYFTNFEQFHDIVADSAACAWIIKVIGLSGQANSLLKAHWRQLVDVVVPFGVKIGVYDCRKDARLCYDGRINDSRLVLAAPVVNSHSKGLKLHIYTGAYTNYNQISSWAYQQISGVVVNLNADKNKSRMSQVAKPCSVSDVCVLLVSGLTLPPFLLSALGVKFSQRATITLSSDAETSATPSSPHNHTHQSARNYQKYKTTQRARYFITVNGRTFEYAGPESSKYELINYDRLCAYLKTIRPTLSDVFSSTLCLINILAILTSVFDTKASPLQLLWHALWTIGKYNVLHLCVWLVVICICDDSSCSLIYRLIYKIWRAIISTRWTYNNIGLLHHLLNRAWRTALSFTIFQTILHALRRRLYPQSLTEPEQWSEWMRAGIRFSRPAVSFHGLRPTFTAAIANAQLPQHIQQLAQQLNLSQDLIVSSVKHDYLLELPIYHYNDIDEHTELSTDQLCLRCKCTKSLQVKNQLRKLSRKNCKRCGYVRAPTAEFRQCAICLDTYKSGQSIVKLPCAHEFHRECVLSWLLTDAQQNCPICRYPAYLRMTPNQ